MNATRSGCRTDHSRSSQSWTSWNGKIYCYRRGGWSAIQRAMVMKDGRCTKGVTCQTANSTQDEIYTICAPSFQEVYIQYIYSFFFKA